jgi:hypothetical protein
MIPEADDILPLLPVDDLSQASPPGKTAAWLAIQLGTSPGEVRQVLGWLELRGRVQRTRIGSGSWRWARCPEPLP